MARSVLTTLCYIEKDGAYLMLHRVSKKNDVNKDKWIGIGGHFEENESPEECLLREAREETGLTLASFRFRGLVTFQSEGWNTEYMCLYTADKFEGQMRSCDEGVLEWVKKEDVLKLNLWEGDKIFFRLMNEDAPFFSLKLSYRGDTLKEAVLNGKPLELFDVRNETGEVTGLVRERVLVHREGDWHGTSHIWVVRENGKSGIDLLLQKRSAGKDSYPGCYDISSAGHVQAGDDFLSSAVRELKEELGIEAEADDLEFAGFHKGYMEEEFYGHMFKDREISAVYIYRKPVDEKSLTLQAEEVESVMWMDLEECMEAVDKGTLPNCIYMDELELVKAAVQKADIAE
ncbi:MAG: NUDIX domain-containing protein [Enterocloster sp.]